MSNSSLVTYKHITSHKTKGRGGHKIDKIFVHHMAANLSVKQCGSVFDNRQASAHYGVNGTAIGQYVDESDTAWHCGNFSWNQRSIGIELANDGGSSTGWHVSDTTISTAIKLIADICKRNNIKSINYTGNLNGNLCMHKWVVSTSCPGTYLSSQFTRIANGVNEMLTGKPAKLEVDGIGGELTVCRMQEFFGTKQDGVITGQKKANKKYYSALNSVKYGTGGSSCIKNLQRWVGTTQDGVLGQNTVKAWQRKIGVTADGYFGANSMKVWQTYLNEHDKADYPPAPTPTPTTNKVLAKAQELSWPKGTNSSKYAYKGGSPTFAFKAALDKVFPTHNKWGAGPRTGASCDVAAATIVRASGVEPNMPRGYSEQIKYTPKNMQKLTYNNVAPSSVAKPGDMICYTKNKSGSSRHVLIVGEGCLYEAQYQKTYLHRNASTSKINTKRPKVIIFRAK